MSDFFMGEIRLFSFNFAPQYWALCDGSVLPVNQYQALFSLLGNQFGGTYPNNFALPDFRGRTAQCSSNTAQPGHSGGAETVALTVSQIPFHTHAVEVDYAPGTAYTPAGNYLASSGNGSTDGETHQLFGPLATGTSIAVNPTTIGITGGGAGHNNMQPSLVMNFCIATYGLYPPRA